MSTTNPCHDWAELLSAYQDRQLSEKETRRVEDHLAGCADCRAALAQWDADRARFTAAYAASTGGVALRTAVLEELRTMKPLSSQISLPLKKYRWLLGLAGTAVVGCILLGGVLLLGEPVGVSPAMVRMEPEERQVALAPQMAAQPTPMPPSSRSSASHAIKSPSAPMDAVERKPVVQKKELSGNRLAKNGPADADIPVMSAPPGEAAGMKGDGTVTYQFASPDDAKRNYGVAGGVQMHYDMDYQLQVKQAYQSAQQAQAIVRRHSGFTMDFRYSANEGEIPQATFRGKVPAEQAESVLAEIEKLGEVRSVNVAGEDLTESFRELYDNLKYQKGAAADYTKRRLSDLGLQKNLVTFSATFVEPKPKESWSLARVTTITKEVLQYALLAFITLAIIALSLALVIVPIVAWRRVRRRAAEAVSFEQERDKEMV